MKIRFSKKIMSHGRKATVRIAWSMTDMWDPKEDFRSTRAIRYKREGKIGVIHVRGIQRANEIMEDLQHGC